MDLRTLTTALHCSPLGVSKTTVLVIAATVARRIVVSHKKIRMRWRKCSLRARAGLTLASRRHLVALRDAEETARLQWNRNAVRSADSAPQHKHRSGCAREWRRHDFGRGELVT